MGKYTVTSGQNLYDIALHIYGSIEGIVDLMMHNTDLSFVTVLKAGKVLIFTDNYIIDPSVISYNKMNNITPANGERCVYFKQPELTPICEFKISNEHTSSTLVLSGKGQLQIDWGDNNPIQNITLSDSIQVIRHSYDNNVPEKREIRFYGDDIRFSYLDLTGLKPSSILLMNLLSVERFKLHKTTVNLSFSNLFENTYGIDLSGCSIKGLTWLTACKRLMTLNLSDAKIQRDDLDNFLISLVQKYHGRRNCIITLTQEPSGIFREPNKDDNNTYIVTSGMEAVWVIVNEPAWNEGGNWEFIINDQTYTNI